MVTATTFPELLDLVRKAEALLVSRAGQKDPVDRACTLRGIYYGTEWSLDYKNESKRGGLGAYIRNLGFITYTGGSLPPDPRQAFAGTTLFDDLQKSQTIQDHGIKIDIGHLLIGLDTRTSDTMRTINIAGQGGTGLEIVTWLGDLGGGTANLARRRAMAPETSVECVFSNKGSDYGTTDNLEGDVGGYLVACGSTPGGKPVYAAGKGVADMLKEYLPLTSAVQWNNRAALFAIALGCTVSTKGITNAKDIVLQLTDKLYDFAVWYAITRWVASGELRGARALSACTHMRSSAQEVATVFVTLLSRAIANNKSSIRATGPYPVPIAPSACTSPVFVAASADASAVRKQLNQWRREWIDLFK